MQQLQRPSSFGNNFNNNLKKKILLYSFTILDVRMNTLKNQVKINNKTSLIFSLNNQHSSGIIKIKPGFQYFVNNF
jgi:hypothetical protein